jgi:hypothetical protein
MTRLHSVLTTDDLPLAELHAARLDGELYALDSCFCPVDELEYPALRANTIAAQWPFRLIAEQRSAAWVHGVTDFPPRRHDLCADIGARARPTNVHKANVREVVIDASEIVRIGRLDVTTPLRTTLDLARVSATFGNDERSMCIGLMRLGGFTAAHCIEVLDSRRNLPNKKVAFERLANL